MPAMTRPNAAFPLQSPERPRVPASAGRRTASPSLDFAHDPHALTLSAPRPRFGRFRVVSSVCVCVCVCVCLFIVSLKVGLERVFTSIIYFYLPYNSVVSQLMRCGD